MRDTAAWALGLLGAYLEAQNFVFIRIKMPEILQWSEDIESIATTIGAVVGVGFLYMAYKLKKLSVREKELNVQIKERELAEDKTASIIDQVIKKLKEDKEDKEG